MKALKVVFALALLAALAFVAYIGQVSFNQAFSTDRTVHLSVHQEDLARARKVRDDAYDRVQIIAMKEFVEYRMAENDYVKARDRLAATKASGDFFGRFGLPVVMVFLAAALSILLAKTVISIFERKRYLYPGDE